MRRYRDRKQNDRPPLPLRPSSGRQPPADLAAEAAVLSAVMLDSGRLDAVLDILRTPAVFFAEAHQRIYQAIIDLDSVAQRIDVTTIASKLYERELLTAIGGPPYLAELLDGTPAIGHVEAHARIVLDRYQQRQVIAAAQAVAAEGYGDVGPIEPWQHEVAKRFADIADNTPARKNELIAHYVHEAFSDLEYLNRYGTSRDATPTGHRDVDRMLAGGYAPDTLTVLAARPGMGKTSLAMQHAFHAAKVGHHVLVFSLEMPAKQLATRLICTIANVNASAVTGGYCRAEDWTTLADAASQISNLRLSLDERPAVTTAEIRSRVRRATREALAADTTLGLVVVDYLQLVTGDGDSREQEISSISRGLKAIAKEFHVPVLALSQLSRSVESRGDKRPLLSDLRESGAIEQDADNVLFIYREDYYSGDKPKNHVAEVVVAKHRAGATGQVPLRWTGHCTRFDDLDTAHDDADARRY